MSSKIKILAGLCLFLLGIIGCAYNSEKCVSAAERIKRPQYIRGIHLTSWTAGSKKARARINELLKETEINTLVIAIKEYEGEVYIPGVEQVTKYKSYINAIPDLQDYLAYLKTQGVYTIARLVVFKDNMLPKKRPDLAVKNADGEIWRDRRGLAWADPYNKEVWDYNLSIASRAVQLGFDEIQFDYIRYPSDGNIKSCRYSYKKHDSTSSANNLNLFLTESRRRLSALGVPVSICLFGLTTSVNHDMGIGQKIVSITQYADYICPMTYPSHYNKGEYGIPNPNIQPYKTVYKSISDALKRLGPEGKKLRPYLQDFSMGHFYGAEEVRAQIKACEDLGVYDWLLWDPKCKYTRGALRTKAESLIPPSPPKPVTELQSSTTTQ